MKRIQKFAAVNIILALVGTGVPALAAQNGYAAHNRGEIQHQSANDRSNQRWSDNQHHNARNNDRGDYQQGYVRGPGYSSAPVYVAPVYRNGFTQPSQNVRTAAIIGGSATAGALIGAAVNQGEGALIGGLIGGVAGIAVSAAADHHDRY